jgi:hypothetical protein
VLAEFDDAARALDDRQHGADRRRGVLVLVQAPSEHRKPCRDRHLLSGRLQLVGGVAHRLDVARALPLGERLEHAAGGAPVVGELDVNERNTAAIGFYTSAGLTTEPKPPGRTLFVARRLDP